jgi:ADP-ribosylglycohydrolase
MKSSFYDGVYGCLIGHTIGDALGAPVETWNYWDIRRRFGKVDRFLESKVGNTTGRIGEGTDDTALRHYVSLAIVRKGGRITPNDLAELWIEKGNYPRLWSNERVAYEKIWWGMDPWDTGRGADKCGSAAMAAGPIGVINAGSPEQAYQDGYVVASLNQDGEERAAAGLFAAAIAEALQPGASFPGVLQTMNRLASFLMRRAMDVTFDLVSACSTAAEFTEKYYERFADWAFPNAPKRPAIEVPKGYPVRAKYYSGLSVELIPVALAMLHFAQGDPNTAMIEAAGYGRDCDTIAAMAGCIGGALAGAHAIRAEWIQTAERANEELYVFLEGDRAKNHAAMAKRLVEAYRRELERLRDRAAFMEGILSQQG